MVGRDVLNADDAHQSLPQPQKHIRARKDRHQAPIHGRVRDDLWLEAVRARRALTADGCVADGDGDSWKSMLVRLTFVIAMSV